MKKIFAFIPAVLLGFSSCDYLDITPVGEVIPESVSDYRALMTSAYRVVPDKKYLLTVRTDELNMNDDAWTGGSFEDIANWNDLSPAPQTYEYPWASFYQAIFYTNSVITDGPNATLDGTEDREQLIGEAYMLRAYMHFELLNHYATPYDAATAATDRGVPISTVIDIEQNYVPASVAAVYAQIWNDINTGLEKMTTDKYETGYNYRFSKDAGYALKARVALYQKDYATALEAAKEVINRRSLTNLNESSVSPVNYKSDENILAMERVSNYDIYDDFKISATHMALYDKSNDLRPALYFAEHWWEGYQLKKCRTTDERVTFRTAEAYLIAAECEAVIGNTANAAEYLATLAANRLKPEAAEAKKAELEAMNAEQLIAEVANERMRELIGEGHRWYDLRRTTQQELNKTVLGKDYTLAEKDGRYTLRIPKSAVEANPDLKD